MKTYTSEELIDLVDEWYGENINWCIDGLYIDQSFKDWLASKEQSQQPVKGQMIWVRDSRSDYTNTGAKFWTKCKFHSFSSNALTGKYDGVNTISGANTLTWWDEYSLTDPNK